MKMRGVTFAFVLSVTGVLGLPGCSSPSAESGPHAIVGTWLVKDSAAPFPFHMYDTFIGTETISVFDADGALTEGPTRPTALEGTRVTLP